MNTSMPLFDYQAGQDVEEELGLGFVKLKHQCVDMVFQIGGRHRVLVVEQSAHVGAYRLLKLVEAPLQEHLERGGKGKQGEVVAKDER